MSCVHCQKPDNYESRVIIDCRLVISGSLEADEGAWKLKEGEIEIDRDIRYMEGEVRCRECGNTIEGSEMLMLETLEKAHPS